MYHCNRKIKVIKVIFLKTAIYSITKASLPQAITASSMHNSFLFSFSKKEVNILSSFLNKSDITSREYPAVKVKTDNKSCNR